MSLFIGTLVFGCIVLLLISFKMLMKREKQIDKFSAHWDGDNLEDDIIKVKKRKSLKPINIILPIAGSITGFLLIYFVTGVLYVSFLGLLLGFIVPKILADSYIKKQHRLMSMQLEQSAEIMASVLRSGSGIVDSLVRASTEVKNPLRQELLYTANEIRLGVSNSEAFQNLANRVPFDELKILSMGINLQQAGMAVNVSKMLNEIQESIRYKIAFQREVSVITAENKMAGWIVSALPFVTLAVTRMIMPDLIAPLFNTTIGLIIFTIALALIVIGVFWMMKVSEVEF